MDFLFSFNTSFFEKKPNILKICKPIYKPFELPITYLQKNVHTLSPIVSEDLELSIKQDTTPSPTSPQKKTMYDHILDPSGNIFAQDLTQEWNKYFTTDVEYLKDTQNVVKSMNVFETPSRHSSKTMQETIVEIWKDTKRNNFLETYSFIEWDFLKHLNHSHLFLQLLSVSNIMSPLMSLLLPIIFLLLPFLLLKMRGIPISFTTYLDVLKNIAKNHFIGKMITNFKNVSFEKMMYTFIMFGLYLFQIYQNINYCHHFYLNIQKINQSLMKLKEWTQHSISNMKTFLQVNENKHTYQPFCEDVKKNLSTLSVLFQELTPISDFQLNTNTMGRIGYMLSIYYKLYSLEHYDNALCYSMGFDGYLNNLLGIYFNIQKQHIHFAEYDAASNNTNTNTSFEQQYYPSYKNTKHITNHCHFEKNIVISGPNASGKTTLLKTTCINIIFSQQMGCGFYAKGTIIPYTHIHSYLNIPDTSDRDSLFQAESRRCKDIIDAIHNTTTTNHSKHFCIFDELFSGTNPKEATKTGYSFLLYLTKYNNVDFMLTTHYTNICKKLKKHTNIQNYKMNVLHDPLGKIQYTYKMKKGISHVQGALEILKNMDFPDEILHNVNQFDEKT